MYNYATKTDFKYATVVRTSLLETNSSNLKSKADKLDDNKLVPVCVDLSKLSDAVKNHVEKLLKSKLLKIKYLILLTQLLILLLILK